MKTIENNYKTTLDVKLQQLQQSEETQMKEKVLKLKEEIAEAEGKQAVFEEEELGQKLGHSPPKSVRFKKTSNSLKTRRRSSSENKKKSRRHTSKQNHNVTKTNDLVEFGQLMIEMMQQNSAPDVKLDEFNGNILEYEYFKANFKEEVEKKIKDQRGRLTRLLQCTGGEAKEYIKGCVHENSNCCYDKAIELLDKEYGDIHAVTGAYLKELRLWPSIRSNDSKGYKAMYRFLLKCQSCKRSGWLIELDSPDIIRKILTKFPVAVQETWNKAAYKIRDKDLREANFDDLVSFIEYQSRLLSNPAYSREAFNTNTKNIPANTSNTSNNNSSGTNKNVSYKTMSTGVVEEKSNVVCVYCGDTDHVFKNCAAFSLISLYDRRQFIFKNRLCFSCLEPTSENHNGKLCQQRLQCAACNEDHPTCLHVFKVNSIRQPGGGTSLPVIPVILHHELNPGRFVAVYAMLDECSQATFIKESVLQSFESVPHRDATVGIETLNSSQMSRCFAADGFQKKAILQYERFYHSTSLPLPTVFSKPDFPVDVNEIVSRNTVSQWPHLQRIKDFMLSEDCNIPVGSELEQIVQKLYNHMKSFPKIMTDLTQVEHC